MNVDRQSLMFYEALIAGAFMMFAGILVDAGLKGTAAACLIIAGASLIALLCTWLGPNPDINDRG